MTNLSIFVFLTKYSPNLSSEQEIEEAILESKQITF
jgi:hypothetical protein